MLGTDDDGILFNLDSSLYIFSENDDGDYDNDFTDSPGEAEINAVTTDFDNTPTFAQCVHDMLHIMLHEKPS
eukprot:608152-Pleurochrysis_carterae.AAC.1